MKDKIRQIVNAALILSQMPTENDTQLAVKKVAVDRLFKDIFATVAEMEIADFKTRLNFYINGFHIGNDGRKRSFTCVCGGDDGFEVNIEVIVNDSVRIIIDSNIDDEPKEAHCVQPVLGQTSAPAAVCD